MTQKPSHSAKKYRSATSMGGGGQEPMLSVSHHKGSGVSQRRKEEGEAWWMENQVGSRKLASLLFDY